MTDQSGRCIDYVRISITDRCNLRCIYCMPDDGACGLGRRFVFAPGQDETDTARFQRREPVEGGFLPDISGQGERNARILRLEEIERIVRILTGLGIKHVRLTGGEPMVRRGCLELAARLHAVPGVESISMTSNGILLKDRIHQAKLAGISSLNISIDALNPAVYSRLTRGGDVSLVLSTLEQALEEGLNVKVNTVPVRGMNEDELAGIAALAMEKPLCVRFIELMPVGYGAQTEGIPNTEVEQMLEKAFGEPSVDTRIYGHGPARYVTYPCFKGSVGYISALSHEFCDSCNRVRLTADGQLKLCLNHTKGLDLRAMLREGADDKEILDAVRCAIAGKPKRHAFYETISDHEMRPMNMIGG